MSYELVLYASDGVTLLKDEQGTDQGFKLPTPAEPGVPGGALTFRIQNDGDAPAISVRVGAAVYNAALDEYLSSGLRALDERWIEIKATGAGTAPQLETGYVPVGAGRYLDLSGLAVGEYHELEVRESPPGSAVAVSLTIGLDVVGNAVYVNVGGGHTETGADGVVSSVGDAAEGAELVIGGPVTASSPEAATVEVPDLAWTYAGVPYSRLATTEALNDQDGSAATLAAGEGYYARLSLGSSLTITKGDKAAVGAPPLVPDPPVGELDLGYVLRDDSGTIGAGDVNSDPHVGRWAFGASSLNLLVGPGRAMVGNALLRHPIREPKSLPASDDLAVYLTEAGILEQAAVEAAKPTPLARRLATVTTTGTDVDLDTLVDHRGQPARAFPVEIRLAVSDGDTRRWINSGRRSLYLLPGEVYLIADVPGAGNATGLVAVDLLVDGVTVFTAQATDDRRPQLALDAGEDTPEVRRLAVSPLSIPEVLEIPPFAVLSAMVDLATAFDVLAPVGLALTVWMEEE